MWKYDTIVCNKRPPEDTYMEGRLVCLCDQEKAVFIKVTGSKGM